jgi:hypothetical protein
LEDAADVLDNVNVLYEAIAARGEGFFERLRGTDVACAGRSGE